MSLPAHISGIAVLCSADGNIQHLLYDDAGIAGHIGPGQPFSLLMDRGSIGKTVDFLLSIREHGIAIGWELIVGNEQTPYAMHFTGCLIGEQILIVGSLTNSDMLKLYEQLLHLNNELINGLRPSITDHYKQLKRAIQQETKLYDEMTRLNNDLMVAQRALAKANADLERLNALKNHFLGMATHDLRSPLGVILSYSEFLLGDAATTLTEDQQQFIEIIHASTEFMLQLVNDLLDVAIIESGKLQLDCKPTDLVVLIRHAVKVHRLLSAKKLISIELIETPLPLLLLDATKIAQAVNNLLGNGMKFSPPNTTITVSIERHPAEVRVLVADQGPGIPADEREKLFQLFQRTSVRSTGGEKSSGLGLAIARQIVQGHGGRIWVESEVGHGSTFTIALPCDNAAEIEENTHLR